MLLEVATLAALVLLTRLALAEVPEMGISVLLLLRMQPLLRPQGRSTLVYFKTLLELCLPWLHTVTRQKLEAFG